MLYLKKSKKVHFASYTTNTQTHTYTHPFPHTQKHTTNIEIKNKLRIKRSFLLKNHYPKNGTVHELSNGLVYACMNVYCIDSACSN